MDLSAQIGIVSIFGRGHWLAAELAKAKVPVTLLDVTAQMGSWQPEDVEGPFGYFQMEGLQEARLSADEKVVKLENGMTFWLEDGPLELRGPTVDYRLEQLRVSPLSLEYLKKNSALTATDQTAFRKLSFEQNWLSNLAHHLSSSVETLSSESLREGRRRPLFENFFVRQASQAGHEKSLKWCEEQGVKVLRHVEVKDLVFEERKKIASLEVRTDRPGLFKAEQLVLCWTSQECALISPKIQQALFSRGVLEPQWAWMRFRSKIQGQGPLSGLVRDQLPIHSVVISDRMLPWSHENLMILQRVPQQNDVVDVWMKIPNNQRFNSQYLTERGRRLKEVLERHLPDNQVNVLELPMESKSTFQEMGPARHPVYSRAVTAMRDQKSVGNVYFDSPEFWASLGWEGQFEHQTKIYQELKSWWDHKEELRIKRELKEAAKQKNRGADL